MAELEEDLYIDIDLDIEHAILTALRETIGKNISNQWNKNENHFVSQKTILQNFLVYNMDKLEEECFCTQGPDGKVYACGEWLNRPVHYNDELISTQDYLVRFLEKHKVNTEKLIFRPDISGINMRKKLWKETNPLNSSYDVPKSGKDSFGQKRIVPMPPPGAAGAGGPPPGMGFGPPPGVRGAGGPPPGMGFGPPPGVRGAGGPPPGMGFGPPPGVRGAGGPPPGMGFGPPPGVRGAGGPPPGMGFGPPPGVSGAGGPPPGMGFGPPPGAAPADSDLEELEELEELPPLEEVGEATLEEL